MKFDTKYIKAKKMRYKTFVLILASMSLILFSSLGSCSGCSKSGRASRQTQQKVARQNSNSGTTKSPDKKIPAKEEPKTTPIIETSTTPHTSVAKLFKELEEGVFMVFALDDDGSGSQGSGFFINSVGIGITNYHVLQDHSDYRIKTSSGEVYEINEILESSETDTLDYVIFSVNNKGDNFKSQRIAKTRTAIGDDVFAIGSPKGLENSLTKGSVSQYRENDRIQIDATIDHGSSGGPLFNMAGEVIGITSSGYESSALNFAVDIQAIPFEDYVKKQ